MQPDDSAHDTVRAYEQKYLEDLGYEVRAKQKNYTINENLLGLTMSGGEIDKWEAPGEGARGWCAPRAEWPSAPLRVTLRFENGEAVALDGEKLAGHTLLEYTARAARESGILDRVILSTDSHDYDDLLNLPYGVATAQRGWIEKDRVLNARPVEELLAFKHRD